MSELKSAPQRIFQNTLALLTGEGVSKGIQLIIIILLARYLSTEGFGIVSFGIAFSLIVVLFADFGLNTLLIREIARAKDKVSQFIHNSAILKIWLAVVTTIGAVVFLEFGGYDWTTKLVCYSMLAFALIQSFSFIFYSVFRAFEQMSYDASLKVVRMILLFAGIWYTISNEMTVVAISLVFPLTEIPVLIAAFLIYYHKFSTHQSTYDGTFTRKLFSKTFFFSLSSIFGVLLLYVDSIMLSQFKNFEAVGLYAAATNIAIAVLFIPVMYATAALPSLSRWFSSSKKSVGVAYKHSVKYMAILGIVIAVGIYLFSEPVIVLLYGPDYTPAIIPLQILMVFLVLRFVNTVSGFTLAAVNRQGMRTVSQAIALTVNICANIVLIPSLSILGAALATAISEIVLFILYTAQIRWYKVVRKLTYDFTKIVILIGVILFAGSFIADTVLQASVVLVVFVAGLFLFKIIDSDDMKILSFLVKKKN